MLLPMETSSRYKSLMFFIPGIVLLVMNLCIARKGNYNNLKS